MARVGHREGAQVEADEVAKRCSASLRSEPQVIGL